ncbi:MAG: hypothetical protein ABIR29_06840 [Chthoniobacterales bacterium]
MRFYLSIIFLAFLSGARAGVDFTPTDGQRTLEGIVFKQTIFHQNGGPISYEKPKGWTISGDSQSLKLTPPNLSQARATMEQMPLPAPQPLDEATTAKLRAEALASVPNESLNVILVAEEKNPLRINQQDTYAVTVSYNFYGQDYGLSLLFANLPDTQLRFRVVARKADFEAVNRAFRASLFTLSWEQNQAGAAESWRNLRTRRGMISSTWSNSASVL